MTNTRERKRISHTLEFFRQAIALALAFGLAMEPVWGSVGAGLRPRPPWDDIAGRRGGLPLQMITSQALSPTGLLPYPNASQRALRAETIREDIPKVDDSASSKNAADRILAFILRQTRSNEQFSINAADLARQLNLSEDRVLYKLQQLSFNHILEVVPHPHRNRREWLFRLKEDLARLVSLSNREALPHPLSIPAVTLLWGLIQGTLQNSHFQATLEELGRLVHVHAWHFTKPLRFFKYQKWVIRSQGPPSALSQLPLWTYELSPVIKKALFLPTSSDGTDSYAPGAHHEQGADWTAILLRRMGFAGLADLIRDPEFRQLAQTLKSAAPGVDDDAAAESAVWEALKLFDFWLTNRSLPEEIALRFTNFTLAKVRNHSVSIPPDKTQRAMQALETWLSYPFRGEIKIVSKSDHAIAVVVNSGNPHLRRKIIIELIDSQDDLPSGAHYSRVQTVEGWPVYHVQLQLKSAKAEKLNEVLRHEINETGWRRFGFPEVLADYFARVSDLVPAWDPIRDAPPQSDPAPYSPGLDHRPGSLDHRYDERIAQAA